MDSLKQRFNLPGLPNVQRRQARKLPATGRGGMPNRPLRGSNGRLAAALHQLREGVPLNWSQMEDDPELVTLNSLQQVAREVRQPAQGEDGTVPPDVRLLLLERLTPHLPKPRPVPVKTEPKTLAGFSENVTVLTQAEDNIELTPARNRWITAVAVVAVLAVAFLIARATIFAPPTYTWIAVLQNGKQVSTQQLPKNWTPGPCDANTKSGQPARRRFVLTQMPDAFPVVYLPEQVQVDATTVYSLSLYATMVSTCNTGREQNPNTVPGTIVQLLYGTSLVNGNNGTPGSEVHLYEAVQVPMTLDASAGSWKEVRLGKQHGVYWEGPAYRDPGGTQWGGDISVMMLESEDIVTLAVGSAGNGMTEKAMEALLSVLR